MLKTTYSVLVCGINLQVITLQERQRFEFCFVKHPKQYTMLMSNMVPCTRLQVYNDSTITYNNLPYQGGYVITHCTAFLKINVYPGTLWLYYEFRCLSCIIFKLCHNIVLT